MNKVIIDILLISIYSYNYSLVFCFYFLFYVLIYLYIVSDDQLDLQHIDIAQEKFAQLLWYKDAIFSCNSKKNK